MKHIRQNTFFLIMSYFTVLVLVLYFISKFIIISSFNELEKTDASKNIKRAKNALFAQIDSLNNLNRDWAIWDESYKFMKKINHEFIDENLISNFFTEQNIDFVIFLNLNGSLHWGRSYDFKKEDYKTIPKSIYSYFDPDSILLPDVDKENKKGLIILNKTPYIISVNRTFRSDHSGPSNGLLLMAQKIDDNFLNLIEKTTQLKLNFYFKKDKKNPEWISETFLKNYPEDIIDYKFKKNFIDVFTTINDIGKKNSAIIHAEIERDIKQVGLKTIRNIFLALFIIVIISSFFIFLYLDNKILKRIKTLNFQLNKIKLDPILNKNIILPGNDELSEIARGYNKILSKYQKIIKLYSTENNELKNENSSLFEYANTDNLTKLPNRKNLLSNILTFSKTCISDNKKLSISIIKIENLNEIKKKYGYEISSKIVKYISLKIPPLLKETYIFGRISQQSFAIVLPETGIDETKLISSKIINSIDNYIFIREDIKPKIDLCFGVSEFDKNSDTIESFLLRAEVI